jgi:lipopolysaccharide transport system permease protein
MYRELLYFLVWRDIKIRYKQTVLGVAWAMLQPLVTTLIFFLFFGRLAGIPSDGVPYPIFAYSALVAWIFFAAAVGNGANSLVQNSNLLTKVYFPRAIMPAAAVLSGVPDFLFSSVGLVAVMAYYGVTPGLGLLLWPLLLIPLALLAIGFSFWLSAFNVKFRDVKYVIPFILQIWLFVTPVIYPVSLVPPQYRMWLALNPITGLIEAFRGTAIAGHEIDWQLFNVSLGVAIFVFLSGAIYFRSAEREFADRV